MLYCVRAYVLRSPDLYGVSERSGSPSHAAVDQDSLIFIRSLIGIVSSRLGRECRMPNGLTYRRWFLPVPVLGWSSDGKKMKGIGSALGSS
jgi:hypothetical protein